MKILLEVCPDDYSECHNVVIDDKETWYITSLSESPEDAIIGRGLISGRDLIAAIKLGYEAAQRGEKLEIEEVETSKY